MCECGANTFKGVMIFLVVFCSILIVGCAICIIFLSKRKRVPKVVPLKKVGPSAFASQDSKRILIGEKSNNSKI